jgi:hypothetical protein
MQPFDRKFGADFLAGVPSAPGVYHFYDAVGVLLYVGKARDLRRRLGQYRTTRRTDRRPVTIVAYGLNGRDLPRGNGAPLRLRVERQCGYKNLKFLRSIQVVDSVAGFGRGTGGTNSDFGFHWFAGV